MGRPRPRLVEPTEESRSAGAAQDCGGGVKETRDGHFNDDELELLSARVHDAPKSGLESFGRKMLQDVEKTDDARAERKPRQDFGSGLILRETMSFDAGCLQALHGDLRRVHAGNRSGSP
jgi:hypothetical protein